MGDVEKTLRAIPDLDLATIESSCCGMAGAFGYQAETIDVSFAMGELSLLPAARAADPDAILIADGTSCRFDAVVVASGHQGVPRHPPFAQDFEGHYLHAHRYRVPEPFKGQHVLVVGVGNSACDIASDICTSTASTSASSMQPRAETLTRCPGFSADRETFFPACMIVVRAILESSVSST
jgi:hypothetical protein